MKIPDSVREYMSPARAIEYFGPGSEDWESHVTELAYRNARQVLEWLPGVPRRILDIGCGLAMATAVLADRTGCKSVCLLDGATSGRSKMGFNPATKAWSDVRMGAAIVKANTKASVRSLTKPPFPECDVVVSFKSWGHHYPIDVYAQAVAKALVPAGVLVLDIRNSSGGRKILESYGFTFVKCLESNRKCDRELFYRSPA